MTTIDNTHRRTAVQRLARALAIVLCGMLAAPPRAFAQTQKWEVDLAPLYFWAATTDGNLAVNGLKGIPIYMDFSDAASQLAGAFSFHGEARKGPWGVVGDVNFVRLSTDTTYTTPIINAPITGTFQFDQVIFNAKAIFEVKPGSAFRVVGGVRTLTMSPNVHFTGPVGGQLADIDISKTNVAGVGGFTYRPRLGKKAVLLAQADIGGGSAFTWSAGGGVEFLIKPWMGLALGYNALRIDTGSVPTGGSSPINDLQYAVTQYGPAFSMTLHWSEK